MAFMPPPVWRMDVEAIGLRWVEFQRSSLNVLMYIEKGGGVESEFQMLISSLDDEAFYRFLAMIAADYERRCGPYRASPSDDLGGDCETLILVPARSSSDH